MRLFIAVPVPEELKERILEVQNRIKITGIDANLVEKENLHFTIKFLGETEKVKEIENAMEKALEKSPKFGINIEGLDVFPSKKYIRVIWLSVKRGSLEFKRLCQAVDEELSKIGFEKEREYVPHLTLARMHSGRIMPKLQKLIEELEKIAIGGMEVNEVKLMKSVLSRKGPVYEDMFCMKLK